MNALPLGTAYLVWRVWISRCKSCETTKHETYHKKSQASTRAGPETCGSPGQANISASLQTDILYVFRVRTGMANISEGACSNYGSFADKLFSVCKIWVYQNHISDYSFQWRFISQATGPPLTPTQIKRKLKIIHQTIYSNVTVTQTKYVALKSPRQRHLCFDEFPTRNIAQSLTQLKRC